MISTPCLHSVIQHAADLLARAALYKRQPIYASPNRDRGEIIVTSNAVIQRQHLPLLGAYVEPRSQTEQALAEIWRRALGMDCVGITDSYEDLGGDSLVAATIFAELEAKLGVQIPWATLVEGRTVERLAAMVDDLKQRTK